MLDIELGVGNIMRSKMWISVLRVYSLEGFFFNYSYMQKVFSDIYKIYWCLCVFVFRVDLFKW